MSVAFSAKISMLRKEKDITQKQAAADLGVSQALLSHYEKGIRECSLDFVQKTARYYGVSADYLLGLTELKHGAEDVFRAEETQEDAAVSIRTLLRTLTYLWAQADADGEAARQFFLNHFALSVRQYAGALTGGDDGAGRVYALCDALLEEKRKKDAGGTLPAQTPLSLRTTVSHAEQTAAALLAEIRL